MHRLHASTSSSASFGASLRSTWRRLAGGGPRLHAAHALPALAFATASAPAARALLREAAPGERHPVLRLDDTGFGVVYVAGSAEVTRRDLRRCGLSEPALHQAALQNLAAHATQGARPLRCVRLPQRLFALTLGDDRASSLVLLDTLWDERISTRLCRRPVVSIPSRELCVFADADDAAALGALRQFTTRVTCDPRRRRELLSSALYLRREGAWRPIV